MKKKIITFILGISLLLGSKIINPDIAYAYDKTNYQYSNGYYYVDNTDKHSTDNHITLNVLQQFNTDYELTNFCNHKLSKNINGEIIKLTNTDKITGIIRQTELVLQRDESKTYSQEDKISQDNEKDNNIELD